MSLRVCNCPVLQIHISGLATVLELQIHISGLATVLEMKILHRHDAVLQAQLCTKASGTLKA
jgi:hypothetical protein